MLGGEFGRSGNPDSILGAGGWGLVLPDTTGWVAFVRPKALSIHALAVWVSFLCDLGSFSVACLTHFTYLEAPQRISSSACLLSGI